MPTADTGDWDLVVEIAAQALSQAVAGMLPTSFPSSQVSSPAFTATVTPALAPAGVTLSPGGNMTISVAFDGTALDVTNLTMPPRGVSNPPPPWLAHITLTGRTQITVPLRMRGNSLVADFTGSPQVTVQLDSSSLLAAPLVQFALAAAYLHGDQTEYNLAVEALIRTISDAIQSAVAGIVRAGGVVTLVPAPALPPPAAISASALLVQAQSLHACYAIGGVAGDVNLITRSMLRRSSVSGQPSDRAAFALGNASLLRDFLRPVVVARLGLPASGFVRGHPCMFIGAAPLPVPAIAGLPAGVIARVVLQSFSAGIDESGLLHVGGTVKADGVGGAFTIDATFDAAFTITASTSGQALTIAVTAAATPVVRSQVSLAWWFVLAGVLTGGVTVAAIDLLAVTFGGPLLNGPIGTALAGMIGVVPTQTIPLPNSAPPLSVGTTRTVEPDSARRVISFSIPGGSFSIPDSFRSHDVIVTLI
jgi:hypothetical protein